MSEATFEQLGSLDPTKTFLFKAAMLFEGLVLKLKLRVLMQICRLLLLGFCEDFRIFVREIELAEDRSRSEAEYKLVWSFKSEAAGNVARLVDKLESMQGSFYSARTLPDYLIGEERLEELKMFIRLTQVECEADGLIDAAKKDFLRSFAKRQLSKSQQAAFLRKYEELMPPAGRGPRPAPRS